MTWTGLRVDGKGTYERIDMYVVDNNGKALCTNIFGAFRRTLVSMIDNDHIRLGVTDEKVKKEMEFQPLLKDDYGIRLRKDVIVNGRRKIGIDQGDDVALFFTDLLSEKSSNDSKNTENSLEFRLVHIVNERFVTSTTTIFVKSQEKAGNMYVRHLLILFMMPHSEDEKNNDNDKIIDFCDTKADIVLQGSVDFFRDCIVRKALEVKGNDNDSYPLELQIISVKTNGNDDVQALGVEAIAVKGFDIVVGQTVYVF